AQDAIVLLVACNKDVHDVLVLDVTLLLGLVGDVAGRECLRLVVLDPDLDVEDRLESPELPGSEISLDHSSLRNRRFATACDEGHQACENPGAHLRYGTCFL